MNRQGYRKAADHSDKMTHCSVKEYCLWQSHHPAQRRLARRRCHYRTTDRKGIRHGNFMARRSLWDSNVEKESGIYGHCSDYAGCWNWGEHCCLQSDQCTIIEIAAGSERSAATCACDVPPGAVPFISPIRTLLQ